jgi:hypothetical protein
VGHRPFAAVSRPNALPEQLGGDGIPRVPGPSSLNDLRDDLPLALVGNPLAAEPPEPVAREAAILQATPFLIFPSQQAGPGQQGKDSKHETGFPVGHSHLFPQNGMYTGGGGKADKQTLEVSGKLNLHPENRLRVKLPCLSYCGGDVLVT